MGERANLYSNNADVKFPLSDFHIADVPNDILTGLSLAVPEGVVPKLTSLRVGIGFVVVIFEDLANGIPVAYARVEDPQSGMIYPLEMDVEGHGFVMFGPGSISNEGYFSGKVEVDLEPEVVTSLKVQPSSWKIAINGLEYDLENVLTMLSANDLITVTIENNVVYIDRNDTVLDELDRADLLDRESTTNEDPRVYTIANTSPDENGNIDIDIEDCIERCADVNSTDIARGDEGAGDNISLPLDIYFPAKPNPDDPCAPSSNSSNTGGDEDEPLCHNIEKETIYNEDNNAIGTKYKPIGDTSSSSSGG